MSEKSLSLKQFWSLLLGDVKVYVLTIPYRPLTVVTHPLGVGDILGSLRSSYHVIDKGAKSCITAAMSDVGHL